MQHIFLCSYWYYLFVFRYQNHKICVFLWIPLWAHISFCPSQRDQSSTDFKVELGKLGVNVCSGTVVFDHNFNVAMSNLAVISRKLKYTCKRSYGIRESMVQWTEN